MTKKDLSTDDEHKKKYERAKNIISVIFIAILLAQTFVFGQVKNLGNSITNSLGQNQVDAANISAEFVQDTVRAQERRMLESARQGWIQYLSSNPSTELLIKDNKGNYVMKSPDGTLFTYNPKTMVQVQRPDNYFDIRDKNTNELLTQQVRPQWNTEEVDKILNTVASHIKAFGATGDVLIFDAYTGEILVDNSLNSNNAPEIFSSDGKKYVQLLYLHPNSKNPDAVKETTDNVLMWRKDSDRTTNIVGYFNEPTDMGSDGNDFAKYPLGQYNREFIEKVLLPYETAGVEGQDMQITITIGAEEQEIYSPYKAIIEKMENTQDQMKKDIGISIFAPITSIFLSFIVIFLAMFALRINVFFSKNSGGNEKPKS
jgi:hypothetical protein